MKSLLMGLIIFVLGQVSLAGTILVKMDLSEHEKAQLIQDLSAAQVRGDVSPVGHVKTLADLEAKESFEFMKSSGNKDAKDYCTIVAVGSSGLYLGFLLQREGNFNEMMTLSGLMFSYSDLSEGYRNAAKLCIEKSQ